MEKHRCVSREYIVDLMVREGFPLPGAAGIKASEILGSRESFSLAIDTVAHRQAEACWNLLLRQGPVAAENPRIPEIPRPCTTHRKQISREDILEVLFDQGLSIVESNRTFESRESFQCALEDVLEKSVRELTAYPSTCSDPRFKGMNFLRRDR